MDNPTLPCEALLSVHENIIAVMLFDKGGKVLATAVKKDFEREFRRSHEPINRTAGYWATLLTAYAQDLEPIFGSTRAITFLLDKISFMVIPIKAKNWIIRLRISGSVNHNDLVKKVKSVLNSTIIGKE